MFPHLVVLNVPLMLQGESTKDFLRLEAMKQL
jgi:hypothetical protein